MDICLLKQNIQIIIPKSQSGIRWENILSKENLKWNFSVVSLYKIAT